MQAPARSAVSSLPVEVSQRYLILASASRARRRLLTGAGVTVEPCPSDVDEQAVKEEHRRQGHSVSQVAESLARLKASSVAANRPGAWVIGADQMLDCQGSWLDKPTSAEEAGRHLRLLRGKTHELVTSACVVRDGIAVWGFTDRARLTMRPLSDAFIEHYLLTLGHDALASVGAYQLEGLGAQLFERVDGDFFTVLGLPLLPLLEFLRREELLPS